MIYMINARSWLLALIVMLAGVFGNWTVLQSHGDVGGALAQNANADTGGAGVKPPLVRVMRVETQPFTQKLSVTGSLIAREEALIKPEIEGLRLVEILAGEGDQVVAGQVLARLSKEDLATQLAEADAALVRSSANIAQAKAQIALAQATVDQTSPALDRAEVLRASGNLAQSVYDQRLAEARTAKAQLNNAEHGLAVAMADHDSLVAQRQSILVKLDHTDIKTPVAGIVSARNARLGAVASASGDPLFKIITGGDVEMDALVPEDGLASVREGQVAHVSLLGGQGVDGRVRLIMPEVDGATHLGHVRIALEHSAVLHPGAFTHGTIVLAARTGLAVPRSAVLYDNGQSVVECVDDRGVVALRSVVTGIISHTLVEVQNGLVGGERVVARAGPFLNEGDVVRYLEEPTETVAKAQ